MQRKNFARFTQVKLLSTNNNMICMESIYYGATAIRTVIFEIFVVAVLNENNETEGRIHKRTMILVLRFCCLHHKHKEGHSYGQSELNNPISTASYGTNFAGWQKSRAILIAILMDSNKAG
jgi:hypothetical protein